MDPVIQLSSCYTAKNPSGDFEVISQYRERAANGALTPNEDRWKIKLSAQDAVKLRDYLVANLGK